MNILFMNKKNELEREPQQYNLTQQVTEAAIRYIKSNENSPFFLYLAHPIASYASICLY